MYTRYLLAGAAMQALAQVLLVVQLAQPATPMHMSTAEVPVPPPAGCASWCADHAGGWQQKCTYVACSQCPQCKGPPAPAPAVPCMDASNPHFDCPAPCFCDTAINATLIKPINNITFSTKYNLQLDLYQAACDSV